MPNDLNDVRNNYHLDLFFDNVENKLTSASVFPLLGTCAGGVKTAMGVVQAVAAVCACTLAGVKRDREALEHSWTHIKHGVSNMLVGILEALPIVQQILYAARYFREKSRLQSVGIGLVDANAGKFMAYPSLKGRKWKIDGSNTRLVKLARTLYREKKQLNGENPFFQEKKSTKKLKEEAIEDAIWRDTPL